MKFYILLFVLLFTFGVNTQTSFTKKQIKHEATMDSIKEVKEKIKNALIKETGINPWGGE